MTLRLLTKPSRRKRRRWRKPQLFPNRGGVHPKRCLMVRWMKMVLVLLQSLKVWPLNGLGQSQRQKPRLKHQQRRSQHEQARNKTRRRGHQRPKVERLYMLKQVPKQQQTKKEKQQMLMNTQVEFLRKGKARTAQNMPGRDGRFGLSKLWTAWKVKLRICQAYMFLVRRSWVKESASRKLIATASVLLWA